MGGKTAIVVLFGLLGTLFERPEYLCALIGFIIGFHLFCVAFGLIERDWK